MTEQELTTYIAAINAALLNVGQDGVARVEIDGMEVLRVSPTVLLKMRDDANNQLDWLRRSEADKNPFVRSVTVTNK